MFGTCDYQKELYTYQAIQLGADVQSVQGNASRRQLAF